MNLLLKEKKVCDFLTSYDIIIPVPISKKREQQRGYNQSTLLARKIAKQLGEIQLQTRALAKIKETIPQSSLNKQERKQNARGAYQVQKREKIYNKAIVIIDDIYTTGSTIEECATVLKNAGAKEVAAITIAKD